MVALISSLDAAAKEEAAAQHIRYTQFVHTAKLLRWYGTIKNEGDYEKDAFFAIFGRLGEARALRAE